VNAEGVEQLQTIRVETGINFGQECYLDPSRAQEFLTQVNTSYPNFFTRNNFQHLPRQFTLGNFDGTKQCTVRPNSLNYTVIGSVEDKQFQKDVGELFTCFRDLFVVNDVRRIGKIFDFQFPKSLTNDSLRGVLKITEEVQVSNLHLLFRRDGKNINLHFLPIEQGVIQIDGRPVNLEPAPIVRCDINNIDMNLPLSIPETLESVFGFADCYVRDDLPMFLDKYFGVTS
jgi:hypothetical protein